MEKAHGPLKPCAGYANIAHCILQAAQTHVHCTLLVHMQIKKEEGKGGGRRGEEEGE